MMYMLIVSLTTISALSFLQMNHPLAMGLTLLIQTVLLCLMTGMMTKSFWFSYILFLIFLGGMLVLFIYVTSLASNEMFSLSSSHMLMMSFLFLVSIITIIISDPIPLSNIMNNEMDQINNLSSFMYENSLYLNKLYNFPTNYLTILLINYLLITLIATVKITNIFKGPLRPMT